MAKMRAVDAAMYVLEKEGITTAFGVPGAAINPFYSAMRKHGGIRHILARHVEGASHMAEGYTRATAGNIGVCQDQTRFPQPERRTVNPPVPDPGDQNASGETPVAAHEAPAPLHEL